jgi:hypothetical protein
MVSIASRSAFTSVSDSSSTLRSSGMFTFAQMLRAV